MEKKSFLARLDADESAAETVEWILLVVVGLVILIAIYYLARWAMKDTGSSAGSVEANRSLLSQGVEDVAGALNISTAK